MLQLYNLMYMYLPERRAWRSRECGQVSWTRQTVTGGRNLQTLGQVSYALWCHSVECWFHASVKEKFVDIF